MTDLFVFDLPLNYNLSELQMNLQCFGNVLRVQILKDTKKNSMDIRVYFEMSSVNRNFYFIKREIEEEGSTEFLTDRGEVLVFINETVQPSPSFDIYMH